MKNNRNIKKAVEAIKTGGVIIFPTETVYGLGANALNDRAVARIYELKDRPRFNPLIVHVENLKAARALVTSFPDKAIALAEVFWPGPLTIIVPRNHLVPDIVTAGLPYVGLRVPNHPLAQAILKETDCPIAAPSANPFGHLSPTEIAHLDPKLLDSVDAVVDGGPCEVGVESTIVGFWDGRSCLLRPGGVPLEAIESLIGKLETEGVDEVSAPLSPGRLPRHYAPKTKLLLRSQPWKELPAGLLGLLCLKRPVDTSPFRAVEVLSEKGDLNEAARKLFSSLRRLDSGELSAIIAEEVPNVGLGLAINDRLKRASHKP